MAKNDNERNERSECDFIAEDLSDSVKTDAMINREAFEERLRSRQNVWGHSELGIEAKKAAMSMLSTKTGMYARIPLMCKSDSCPYKESCPLLEYNLAPHGEACPVEAAQIETRYAGYMNDFDLNTASFTDQNLVSEIINLDIMIERCKALIAKEQVPVQDVVAGIGQDGTEYMRPEVSKHLEAYDKLVRRRGDLYQLMMATRFNKKDVTRPTESISDIIAKIQSDGGFKVEERPKHLQTSTSYKIVD